MSTVVVANQYLDHCETNTAWWP